MNNHVIITFRAECGTIILVRTEDGFELIVENKRTGLVSFGTSDFVKRHLALFTRSVRLAEAKILEAEEVRRDYFFPAQ